VRRLATLALTLLLVTLDIQLVTLMRYAYAIDAIEVETARVAATVVPGTSRTTNPADRLARRVADLRGSGVGYSATAAAAFAAVRDVPNVQLTAVRYGRDGSLRMTVQGDTPSTIALVQQRIEASGFEVAANPSQDIGNGPVTEMMVRGR